MNERKNIAIGFNNNHETIKPIICMSTSDNVTKKIANVIGIDSFEIHVIDFASQKIELAQQIDWPDRSMLADVTIEFTPSDGNCTVRISGVDRTWIFSVCEATDREENPEPPREVVDRDRLRELEERENNCRVPSVKEFHEMYKAKIFGQDEALFTISKAVISNLSAKNPSVLTFFVAGPTGCGKTFAGTALSELLTETTGHEYGLQQVALNTFGEAHHINRFFGSPPSYVGFGQKTIFEPIRSNPYQVYVLDEVEKAHESILTGLMECFSAGKVTLADNSPEIDLSHVIFIITSNIPIDMDEYNSANSFTKKEICRKILSEHCGRPEIAGKIGNCLAFQPLSSDAITDIVCKFVREELENHDMKLYHIDEELFMEFKNQNTAFGARGVKDVVKEAISNVFALEDDLDKYKDKDVSLGGSIEDIKITIAA